MSSSLAPRRLGSLFAVTALVASPVAPLAADDEATGTIRGTAAAKLSLAVPPTVAGPGVRLADAAELGDVLRDDLDFSGWFGILDPRGEGRIPPDRLGEPAAWRAVGADYLLTTQITSTGEKAELKVRIVETRAGEPLFAKTWVGQLPRDLRRMAHAAADTIVEEIAGGKGIAQTRIAFASRTAEGKEIFLMDYDGARVRRLTTTSTINLLPSWSPDAQQLVFLSFLGRRPSIYLLDENGGVKTLKPRGGDLNASPDFAPDGRTLAFSSNRDGNSEIYLYDLETHRERRLTRHPAIDTAPSWSPDGTKIAFTSDRAGGPQIYVMNRDGSGTRRLTWEGRYNESAAWSPDGRRIAFVSRLGGRYEIVIHDLVRGTERIITKGPGNKENPRWAPDGRHLVFAGNKTGRYQIYTIRDDGSDLRQVTRGSTDAETPDWSPRDR